MILFVERNTLKRYLRYIFFITLILWTLTTIFVLYQYLWSSSKQVVKKWWTFVEWIFDTTSFLPYLNNDRKSKFYQWLMFHKCLDFTINKDGEKEYENSLCDVKTSDYKTYYVTLNSWYIWSDWVPMTIDDVFFTYDQIIKNNKLEISYLWKYKDIEIEQQMNKIQVVFKNASEDNNLFFTNYILPRHPLLQPSLEMYQQSFAIEPVYNNCARIKSQSTDQYSLIFDLSNCDNTNLWFYQIKNVISFDNFRNDVNKINWSIIDAYIGNEILKWYESINLETNRLVTLFFNTKSNKMTVRLRRSLGWLINYNFFEGEENEHMKKYDRDIFSYHLSTWWKIETFLNRVNDVEWSMSKQELVESDVKELENKIKFSNKQKAYAFYTEDSSQNFKLNFEFDFDKDYEKIAVQHNSWTLYYPSSFNKKDQKSQYSIAGSYENLNYWANNYTIFGLEKWKEEKDKEQIWTISLYNLYKKQEETQWIKEQIKILYFDNDLSNYVISNLKRILKKYGIEENFVYEKIGDTNELEWKLVWWEYDIFVNVIDMWLNSDISKLFSSESPTINPSQYMDGRMISLLKQYNEAKNKSKIVNEINKIYANDMPMVVLWRQYIKLNLKENILEKLNMEELTLYEYNRRDEIYKNLSLTENLYIDREKVRNFKNFWAFIKNPE